MEDLAGFDYDAAMRGSAVDHDSATEVDPRIEAIRRLCLGDGVPDADWEPPGRDIGFLFDVSNTGKLLALLDEIEAIDYSDTRLWRKREEFNHRVSEACREDCADAP